ASHAARMGRDARDRLASLVLHRWVRLKHETSPDRAGRSRHAYVITEDGRFVNEVLVREGLARVARGPLTRRAERQRAEDEAKGHRRGIWSTEPGRRTLELPPSSWSDPQGFSAVPQ